MYLQSAARQDLGDILSYIGKMDPENALAFVNCLRTTCRRLSRLPESGRARGDLRPRLRSFPVDRYVIFYRAIDSGGVEIVRVLHGARDIESIFGDD